MSEHDDKRPESETPPGDGQAPAAAERPEPGPAPAPEPAASDAGPAGSANAETPAEAAPPAPPAEDAPAPASPADAKPAPDLKRILEALLFASDAPLTPAKIREAIPRVNLQTVKAAAEQLKQEYDQAGLAFELVEIAEGYQLLTRPAYDDWIARLKKAKSQAKLSGAALESLAIIAYKQPIRRVDIEAIRGVQSGELIRALMERGLIRIAGRADQPGSPLLYGTTKEFLDVVGLKSLEELPKPEEVR
jgi:segregation and condensation protein B